MDSNSEIILAATLAGLVAIAVTVAIEKFGGILGGIIGTVPTTIIPAAAFMWLADSNQSAFESAMGMVPVGMLLNAVFLWLWRVVPPKIPDGSFGKRLVTITILNLRVWITGAFFSVLMFSDIDPLVVGCVALTS